jgi:hypothetical protein
VIINNAASRRSVDFWASHLTNTEENERAELREIRGLDAGNVREALEEMQRLAHVNPRVKNFMHHADFNPRRDEVLTDAERDRAIEIYEERRGIPENTPRVVMEHIKEGRKHWHVIWLRVDENGRAFSDSLSAKVAHEAAREIERELGHEKVIGPYDREQGTPRPPRRDLKPWEMYRGIKTNIDPRDVTAEITDLRQQCADGIEFHAALEKRGYILARGDKIIAGAPALMLIDPAGSAHHLTRRIDGMNSKQVNEFMRDVDRAALPDIRQAQAMHQDRKIAALEADRDTVKQEIEWEEKLAKAAIEKEKIEGRFIAPEGREKETRGGRQEKEPAAHQAQQPPTKGEAVHIWNARERSDSPGAFAAALDQHGIALAAATQEEADRSRVTAAYAKAIGNFAPEYRPGEIVAVTERGQVFQLNRRTTGKDRKEIETFLAPLDRSQLQGIEATKGSQEQRRREAWLARQPLGRTAGEIRLAYSLTQTGQEFANAIEDRGSILARMTDADAERLNRWERQRLKEEWTAPPPAKTAPAKSKERTPEDKYRSGELVVVNQYGQVFQLTRQNTGHDDNARAERLKDIDSAALLSVTAAQGVMREVQQHRQEERRHAWQQQRKKWLRPAREEHWPTNAPQPERKAPGLFQQAATEAARDERTENLHGAAAQAWTAYRQSGNEGYFERTGDDNKLHSVRTGDREAFAAALDNRGIAFAKATKEEADRSNSKEAAFARAVGNYAPRYKEGEIVLVTEPRAEYRRDGELTELRRVHKLDQSLAEKFIKTLDNRSQLKGIEATKQALDERAEKRAADREAARLDYATNIKSRTAIAAADLKKGVHKSATVAGNVLGGLGKGFHALSNAFDSLISPKLSPEQIYQGEKAKITREAEAEYSIDFSRYTSDRAQEHQNNQEQQAARDRQREIERER